MEVTLTITLGKVLFATDDFFEICESLLLPTDPIFDINAYVPEGKLMDGWETRRKRTVGHDFCIIKLGFEGILEKVLADTAFFTGNHVPAISIQGISTSEEFEFGRVAKRGTCATQELVAKVDEMSKKWTEILPFTRLKPGYPETRLNYLTLSSSVKATHIRLNYFPGNHKLTLRRWSC
jgi:allantoicase